MSADNWTQCPRCRLNAVKDRQEKAKAAEEAYGKVGQKEYLELLAESQMPIPAVDHFREDYGIGMAESGEFSVSYRGSCQDCGFEHAFKTSQRPIEADMDRACCECAATYACDLQDKNDDPVFCPKCREKQPRQRR